MIQVNRIKIIQIIFVIGLSAILYGCAIKSQSQATTLSQNEQLLLPANKSDDIVGEVVKVRVKRGESMASIGNKYDMGLEEMFQANPKINPNRIRIGATVVVPRQYILPPADYRSGIVISIAEMRLYYFDEDGVLAFSAPIALGKSGWRTPLGSTYIFRKKEHPSWNPPKSIREATFEKKGEVLPKIVPPGQDNPLGDYALYLHMHGYLIHGTNNPYSIGRLVTSGCIRLHNRDIAELYHKVQKGTPVHIIYYPNKVGWSGRYLYLESHKPIVHEERIYQDNAFSATQVILAATKGLEVNVDWDKVTEVVKEHTGIPTIVGSV